MTSLKDSLLSLVQAIGNTRRRQKLAQYERDFRLIVERTQRERTASAVTEIAQTLKQTLADVEQRISARPADRSVVLYDLSRSNRAARDANDQIKFTAVTLTIISERAKELESILASNDVRENNVSRQLQNFLDSPVPVEDD